MYPLTFDASRTDGAEDPGLGQSNKCESPVALLENEPPPAIMKCESNVSLDSLCSDAINKDQKVRRSCFFSTCQLLNRLNSNSFFHELVNVC